MTEQQYQGEEVNTALISLVQYILSVGVIIVHCGSLTSFEPLHFVLKSILGRMAVPFFIICASFFLHHRSKIQQHKYFQHSLKNYLIWSGIYIPYAVTYFWHLHQPLYLFPFGMLIALFYAGMCYHLWYIPAFLLGYFLVDIVLHHLGNRWTCLLVTLFYLWGSIETYSSYLAGTKILQAYQTYSHLFFTARNGIFHVPLFVYLGYFFMSITTQVSFVINL